MNMSDKDYIDIIEEEIMILEENNENILLELKNINSNYKNNYDYDYDYDYDNDNSNYYKNNKKQNKSFNLYNCLLKNKLICLYNSLCFKSYNNSFDSFDDLDDSNDFKNKKTINKQP